MPTNVVMPQMGESVAEGTVVRWITAEDNYRARGLYDKVAQRTSWLTYDMAPADGG